MELVSVIIPARRERYLDKTIAEVKDKFKGLYEIIVVLDGEDANRVDGVKYIYNIEAKGMRTAINQAVAAARGKYLMKLDAHCMLDSGIDTVLKSAYCGNWVQIPRRKRLNAHKWEITEDGRPDIDYMYINRDYFGVECRHKGRLNADKMIDDTEVFQGSCYFITKEYFNKLGLLDNKNFGGSGNEATEIAFKVRHDGGRVVVNKNTWYAHARLGRLYSRDDMNVSKSREYIKKLAKQYGY